VSDPRYEAFWGRMRFPLRHSPMQSTPDFLPCFTIGDVSWRSPIGAKAVQLGYQGPTDPIDGRARAERFVPEIKSTHRFTLSCFYGAVRA
jgi:hypothetical protein